MWRYLAQRLLFSLVTLFLVASFVFVIVRVIPGDPAQTMLGDQASQEALVALRNKLGLDQPILVQYATFLADVARGDWGVSMVSGRSVLGELMGVLPSTLELTFAALLIGAAIGMPLGVVAALKRNRLTDYAMRIGSLAGISFPAFVSGPVSAAPLFGLFPALPGYQCRRRNARRAAAPARAARRQSRPDRRRLS